MGLTCVPCLGFRVSTLGSRSNAMPRIPTCGTPRPSISTATKRGADINRTSSSVAPNTPQGCSACSRSRPMMARMSSCMSSARQSGPRREWGSGRYPATTRTHAARSLARDDCPQHGDAPILGCGDELVPSITVARRNTTPARPRAPAQFQPYRLWDPRGRPMSRRYPSRPGTRIQHQGHTQHR